MPAHDVAIYSPYAHLFYDRAAPYGGGGAERQTWLLARSLARRGARVAHIVYPVQEPVLDPDAPVTLVQRPRPAAHGSARALAEEATQLWRALSRADAAVVVLRGASGALGIAGAWTRRHRRRLVFAGANDADFTLSTFHGAADPRARLYRAGMRRAQTVVVQSDDQVRLARERFPHQLDVQAIPSFVEPAPPVAGPGEAFLWISRLADYKRPLLFADLAQAVPEASFWMIHAKSAEAGYEQMRMALERRERELANFQVLPQRSHAELQDVIVRAIAIVNTSSFEGMPNTWLEGWARGVPALTLTHDPDGRIARHGLGISANGSWDAFVAGARDLWARRDDRGGFGPNVRAFVADTHGEQVERRWAQLLLR